MQTPIMVAEVGRIWVDRLVSADLVLSSIDKGEVFRQVMTGFYRRRQAR